MFDINHLRLKIERFHNFNVVIKIMPRRINLYSAVQMKTYNGDKSYEAKN